MNFLDLQRRATALEIVLGISGQINHLHHRTGVALPRLNVFYEIVLIFLIWATFTDVGFDYFGSKILRFGKGHILCRSRREKSPEFLDIHTLNDTPTDAKANDRSCKYYPRT